MANPPGPAYCECCEPHASPAPAQVYNRPGLDEIGWRTGTYATFRQAMIEDIGTGPPNPEDPDDTLWPTQVRAALANLATRDDADYAIMLVDLFAAVADVLGFYSERCANEIFLRTARERDSVLRMVRLIGFRLSPGLAATTALAFTLDKGASAKLGAGLKVMSVPGQDEQPQTFETIGAIAADARLNDLPVFGAPAALPPFAQGRRRIPILARPDALLPGDTVAILDSDTLELNEVRAVDVAPDGEYLTLADPISVPGTGSHGFKVKGQLRFFGHNLPDSFPLYIANPAIPAVRRWVTRTAGVHYFVNLAAGLTRYALDTKVDSIKPGALVMADRGAGISPRYAFALVAAVEADKNVVGPLADTVTWLHLQPVAADGVTPLAGVGLPAIADVRKTRLFELARPAIRPRTYAYPDSLIGGTAYIRQDHLDDATLLAKKQRIVISDGANPALATITSVTVLPPGPDGVGHIQVGFTPSIGAALPNARINANVAPASHGETQPDESIGHGDSAKLFQRFKLQRKPVTRLPGGAGVDPETELSVRVNGELWDEAPSLYGRGPNERLYTVRDNDDGSSVVTFGDGRTGARLPSGAGNVVARYRTGLGLGGRVKAGQLTTLLSRPVGLSSATNPLPADGGADPQTLDDARGAAPGTVRTFGRAISLLDFEDVARQTGLVARARATWAWSGLERAVQLTVAGEDGARLSADAMATLYDALGSARDPNHPLILGNLWRVPIVVTARVVADPKFEADAVADGVLKALLAFMDFDVQPLARPLHLSQITAAMQEAAGVVAVDVDRFQIKGFATWTSAQLSRRGATTAPVQQHLRLFDARPLAPPALLDPLSLAGLALDPDVRALPAEQAFIQTPATDVSLSLVGAL